MQWHTLPFHSGNVPSIFSKQRFSEMLEKQKFLFTQVRHNFPQVQYVTSYSWLFGLSSVCRLFPSEFTQDKSKICKGYRGLATWGQFLNKSFLVKRPIAQQFLADVEKAKSKEEIFEVFPYKTYECKCNITEFLKFLNI